MKESDITFKDMTLKQKLSYIWDYYKLLIILGIIVIGILIYVAYKIANPGAESICNVVFVDAESYGSDDDVFAQYLEEKEYDTSENIINTTFINTSVYTSQLLTAELMTGEVDIIIAEKDVMENLQESGALAPLDEILGTEALASYGTDLYVAEAEEEQETISPNKNNDNNDGTVNEEDKNSSEEGENNSDAEELTGHIYAIQLPEDNEIVYEGYYSGEVWVAIANTAANEETAVDVLEYLMIVQDHSFLGMSSSELVEYLESLATEQETQMAEETE